MSVLVEKLITKRDLEDFEFRELIFTDIYDKELFSQALKIKKSIYKNDIYFRGLLEITNYCKNNCYYCGIRRDNNKIQRYRLESEEIIKICINAYDEGFRTFVLQGGEDLKFSDEITCNIIKEIKKSCKDAAITLSLGEKDRDSYVKLYNAGADRYLLRHETADRNHYTILHPEAMQYNKRIECLWNLKKIGYQVGSGFLVGSPYQKEQNLIDDIRFLQKLDPDMIGIGPFVAHKDTKFCNKENGSIELTIRMIAILRILFPEALIPVTTALLTLDKNIIKRGFEAGANVLMPNISPIEAKENYRLYDNKFSVNMKISDYIMNLKKYISDIGFDFVIDRGDRKEEMKIDKE